MLLLDIEGALIIADEENALNNLTLDYLINDNGTCTCKLCGEVTASRTHWYRHKYKVGSFIKVSEHLNKLSFLGSQCLFVQVRKVRGVFQVQEGLRRSRGQQTRAQDAWGRRETQVQEGAGGPQQGPQGDPGQEGGRDGAEDHREGEGRMQGTGGRRG